jgi:hypothetical protein
MLPFLGSVWSTVSPVLGNIGKSLASSFLSMGASNLSSALAKKGISIRP